MLDQNQLVGDTPLLLLTTRGARSNQRRTTTLRYLRDNHRLIVFAANAGSATHPGWYYNLLKYPDVTIEINNEIFGATALVTTGEERKRLIAQQTKLYPRFAEYQAKTSREIPVIALERRST